MVSLQRSQLVLILGIFTWIDDFRQWSDSRCFTRILAIKILFLLAASPYCQYFRSVIWFAWFYSSFPNLLFNPIIINPYPHYTLFSTCLQTGKASLVKFKKYKTKWSSGQRKPPKETNISVPNHIRKTIWSWSKIINYFGRDDFKFYHYILYMFGNLLTNIS